jgi:aromatic ring hydroxylase
MKVPATRIAHVVQSKDPAVLAKVVEEVQKGILKREK